MAIYHFSVKTISRSSGRTATASAAYRSGEKIVDYKTGEVHNYSRKSGVLASGIIAPENSPEWAKNREQLWNNAEQSEKRKNSTVAREIVIALPNELDHLEREKMVIDFSNKLIEKHNLIVDYAIHEPSKQGDERNYHAHLLLSTRRLESNGFTEKTREWDDRKSGTVDFWREQWADHTNRYLEKNGISERVSHLSLAEQGIDNREPTKHKGVSATAIERRAKRLAQQATDLRLMDRQRLKMRNAPQKSEQGERPSGYSFSREDTVSNDWTESTTEKKRGCPR